MNELYEPGLGFCGSSTICNPCAIMIEHLQPNPSTSTKASINARVPFELSSPVASDTHEVSASSSVFSALTDIGVCETDNNGNWRPVSPLPPGVHFLPPFFLPTSQGRGQLRHPATNKYQYLSCLQTASKMLCRKIALPTSSLTPGDFVVRSSAP